MPWTLTLYPHALDSHHVPASLCMADCTGSEEVNDLRMFGLKITRRLGWLQNILTDMLQASVMHSHAEAQMSIPCCCH